MPELPEVETVRRTLENFIIGAKIIKVEVLYDKIIDGDSQEFIQQVEKQTFQTIERLGKYLIFKLDNVAFISHLRMEGKYLLCLENEKPTKHDHVLFYLEDGRILKYNDVRKFGRIKLVNYDHYLTDKALKKLGPEPFVADYLKLYEVLQMKNKPIKTVLLDQSVLAGIGNIYANEICYALKIAPQTPANSLTKEQVKQLLDVSSKLLQEAIKQGGTTIHSFSSNGIDGLFQRQLKVHMQKHCPEGHEIKKITLNGRGTYYCPFCQK